MSNNIFNILQDNYDDEGNTSQNLSVLSDIDECNEISNILDLSIESSSESVDLYLNKIIIHKINKADPERLPQDTKLVTDKTLLCHNMITQHTCRYNNKCKYAHSLDQQQLLPNRKWAYALIKSCLNADPMLNQTLEYLDPITNKHLYDELIVLTRVCSQCVNETCHGGYNCRNGAIGKQYKICYHDLLNGKCNRDKCIALHLSEKGLTPYKYKKTNIKLGIRDEKTKPEPKVSMDLLDYRENNDAQSSSYSDDEIKVHKIIKYLNSDIICDDEESIFIE